MLRLIASDLDGTFVAADGLVSEVNKAAVARAGALGVPFVVATGRPVRWLGILKDLPAMNPLVIVSNGAAVYDIVRDRLTDERWIDRTVAADVVAGVRAAVPGVSFAVEQGRVFGREPSAPSLERTEPWVVTAPAHDLLDRGPFLKLMIYHPGICSDELAALAAPIVADRLNLTHSIQHRRHGLLELSAPGVSKAKALAAVCAELGVDAAEVVAFGDMPNDLDMLTWAGQPFVMQESHPDLLAQGFPVAGSVLDSGVGRTMMRLLGDYEAMRQRR